MNRVIPAHGRAVPCPWTPFEAVTSAGDPSVPRVALAIVSLAVSTITGCGASAAAPSEDPGRLVTPPPLHQLVGEGADLALDIKIADLVRSPYFDLLTARAADVPLTAAGAEIEWLSSLARRTDALVVGAWLAADDTLETVMLMRGRYRAEDAREIVAGEAGLSEERRPGSVVFERGGRAIALVGSHTIVVGHGPRVRASVARFDAPIRARASDDAVAVLSTMERLESVELAAFVRVREQVGRLLSELADAERGGGVRALSVEADVEQGLSIRFELATESEAAASVLRPIVDARAQAVGGTALAEVLGLGPALEATRTETLGNRVVAHVFVDDGTLRAVVQAARELAVELGRDTP
jgi:hypothetical protein